MSRTPKDPLLAAARIIIALFLAISAFAAVFLLIATPLTLIFQDSIVAEFAKGGVREGTPLAQPIFILLASCTALMALIAWFLINLLKLVGSVQEGDPFVATNAARLARMAWITLATQVVVIPITAYGRYLDLVTSNGGETISIYYTYKLDFRAVVLVLMLFILARVFRHGAAMREDLEGTV